MKKSLVIFLSVVAFQIVKAQYKTSLDQMCDGHPALQVGSFEGSCIGLVANKDLKDTRTNETFLFPRKIVELMPKRFLILDMGGWSPPNRGALWELDLQSSPKKLWKLVKGLHLPHGLAWGPDGQLYVGESRRIIRFSKESLLERRALVPDVVVDKLKLDNSPNMHPLINFTFGQGSDDFGDLYVNIGAPTDACSKDAPGKCSVDTQFGLIRKYRFQTGLGRFDSQYTIVAKGLRNSMGIVSHSSGTLLQAENSRDFSAANEPFDELNLVEQGKHYGWPYCYNFQATSPEWKSAVSCNSGYEAPLLLFPPHSAPLDLIYYTGHLFPELKGHLLVSWHGYKPTGSRVVSLPTDEKGIPNHQVAPSWEYGVGNSRQVAQPEGGNLRATKYFELISSWDKREGVRPAGAPVGLLVASDGSIFIVEDKNKTVLRLAKGEGRTTPIDDANQVNQAKKIRLQKALMKLQADPWLKEAYDWINTQVLQTNCVICHRSLKGSGTEAYEFMISEQWIEPGSTDSLLIQRLRGLNGLNKMPLGSDLPSTTTDYIEEWVKRL